MSLTGRHQGFGIQAHEVVLNFFAAERVCFIEGQELDPMVYADQFVNLDPAKALEPEEVLRRARLIMATELGKDPLLRDHVRKLFKEEARVSVDPTEHGMLKIHESHQFYARKISVS
jgi:transcription elongation factor SPT6